MNIKKISTISWCTLKQMSRFTGPIVLGLVIGLGAVLALLAMPAVETSAAGPDDGYVVVQFDDGGVIGRAISFTGAITGAQALTESGLDVVLADTGFGIAVCSIEGVGCPADDCFCQCAPPDYDPCIYWGQYYQDSGDSNWISGNGAGVDEVGDGGAHGFSWGPQTLPPLAQVTSSLKALDWLRDQQSATDGGYGNQNSTAQSVFAVGANKFDLDEWRTGVLSPSLFDYWSDDSISLPNNTIGWVNSGKRAGFLSSAAVGAGEDPQSFGGLDLVISLTNYYSPTTGAFDPTNIGQAWAILGWRAANTDITPVPVTATQFLVTNTNTNGGWAWSTPGDDSDTNTTSLAIQALIAGGECITSPNIANALQYLKSAQNTDGGFTYDPNSIWGTDSDTNSTAYVVQGLLAVGEDPTSSAWTISGNNPISYLFSMQLPDGSFEWQTGWGANLLATQQAIPALLGQPFPLWVDFPDQGQCVVSASPHQGPGAFLYWLPIVLK